MSVQPSVPSRDYPIVAVSSKLVYDNSWIRVREDTTKSLDGSSGIYGVVESNDSVVTCAINEKNELYLVYAYSYPANEWSWQVPGGGGNNEDPLYAATRELVEETGLRAAKSQLLASLIVSCGVLKEVMHVVVAYELTEGKRIQADDNDAIRDGKFCSSTVIKRMIKAGEICDSQSISAIHLLQDWLEEK